MAERIWCRQPWQLQAAIAEVVRCKELGSGAGLTGDDVPKKVDKDFLTNQSIDAAHNLEWTKRKSSGGSGGMPTFTKLKGKAAAIDLQNIDTDMIIPKQF